MLRPSLSEKDAESLAALEQVSPELMLRPSLSVGLVVAYFTRRMRCVAGAYAPAFVERPGKTGDHFKISVCRRSLCSGLR